VIPFYVMIVGGALAFPDEVEQAYLALGTHPDRVAQLR
jgi:hypothetical protein